MTAGVPEGYHSVQPYLMFRGTVAAIAFYAKAFGATERLCMKQPDGRVAHAEVQIGDSVVMMADENASMDAWAPEHFGGSPVGLLIYTADCDAMYAQVVAAGAVSLGAPQEQPHGARMGGVQDPFGYKWWIATQQRELTREELERTA